MAASPTGSSSSAPAAAAAAAAEATDGPTLSVVSKRLRALRKKHNRILQMEESLAGGRKLNKEQEGAREFVVFEDFSRSFYFGTLFDFKPQTEFVATMVARAQERDCCITYDYVTEDAADLLHQSDLDKVSALAALAALGPAAAVGVSHRDALQSCAQHARLWLRRADEPIHPESSITYAAVRAKLDKIMASDYYTAQPEMPEMGAAVDLSAAVQESMVVSPEAPAVEESQAEGHKEQNKYGLSSTRIRLQVALGMPVE
ncbi:hypothetical protein OsJ_12161 [Oryza sativa Japonica Group]|uniref:Uncharacterized protein n=1 Tax=Oryza sativa subsp. japonica TaxID=39947 RepID=B9FAN9_ORYSJ|nr:hypothetical protein OsJ_12161 [Oryza sativa Japonica Group]